MTGVIGLLTAVSMTVGRGPAAQLAVDLATPSASDTVVDIGCGPGTAARQAVARGATVVGIDPDAAMLGLARLITKLRRTRRVTWLRGSAESLPLPDESASIVWALSTTHHWSDRSAGLVEAHRVLVPGGRVLLMERLVGPKAHSHAAHGLTEVQADELAGLTSAAGFVEVERSVYPLRRPRVVVRGRKAS